MTAAILALTLAPITWTLQIDGLERTALVVEPTIKIKNPPLVFGFHGHGGSSRNAYRSFAIHETWPEAVCIYPMGLATRTPNDLRGERTGWQVSRLEDRDLKFFDALLSKAKSDLHTGKTYVMGHSNGGRFSYVLWANRPDKIDAFGPSAAPGTSLVGSLVPKPAFIIGGEKDTIVDFKSQRLTMDQVMALNGASRIVIDLNGAKLFKGTNQDTALWVHAGGHEFYKPAVPAMVEFFKQH
jgi:polyhydroxybutyrate depolymerase